MLNHYACERVTQALKRMGITQIPKHEELFNDLFNRPERKYYLDIFLHYAAYIAYKSVNERLIERFDLIAGPHLTGITHSMKAIYYEGRDVIGPLDKCSKGTIWILNKQVTAFNVSYLNKIRTRVAKVLRFNQHHISDESFEVTVFYKLIEGSSARVDEMLVGGRLLLLIRSIKGLVSDVIEHIISLMVTISIAN